MTDSEDWDKEFGNSIERKGLKLRDRSESDSIPLQQTPLIVHATTKDPSVVIK
jgi:hypothetical protein